jgi:hypothetical protein
MRLCYSQAESRVLGNPIGPWHQGCVNQAWNTAIDPRSRLPYAWENGRVSLYEQRRGSQYRYVRRLNESMFPTERVRISGHFQAGFFATSGYAEMAPVTTPDQVNQMRNNRCNGFACVFVLKEGRLTNALGVSDATAPWPEMRA